ncbi:inositol monophosphatase family protein [Candidatus Enterococcus willemsii]|uniref:Inositol monophosphatase n=1 Tax=Candidatus Enterococcus willemsii TaxID=1857215 RepID=A0ABQ6YYP7_9ENTE|nr:inositol monophosphatase family protein [Enterococcus sp. CU12B]KAF1302765.1 inositol monophosphatase [Enterococcus sp. CU12B]
MQIMISEIKNWMKDAGEIIKEALKKEGLTVDTKTSRKDLVTNLDKQTQDYLIKQILAFDPNAKILGEENGKDQLTDLSGRVFIIDPIDGTMNFVLEHENFCIMIAVYEEGQGVLGFVYDVMKEDFLWGGRDIGVFLNEERVPKPKDCALNEGLLGMNAVMYANNIGNARIMGERSMGVRMSGCAGVELMGMALGKRVGYVSNLAPWDYAAGGILIQALGMKMSNLYGKPLQMNGREQFIAGTPQVYEELLTLSMESLK